MLLSAITEQNRPVEVVINGEKLHVTYNPAGYTPNFESEIKEKIAAGDSQGLALIVHQVISDWDLLESEAGPKVSLEVSTLCGLPIPFLADIINAVMGDQSPKEQSSKDLGSF